MAESRDVGRASPAHNNRCPWQAGHSHPDKTIQLVSWTMTTWACGTLISNVKYWRKTVFWRWKSDFRG